MSGEQQRTKPSQRGLPHDVAPGEAEIIDAFYEWVHENHPNPERIGCPGRLALAELVVTETEFEDNTL